MTNTIINPTTPTLATVVQNVRQLRDNKQSVKAFNKKIEAYVKTAITVDMAKEIFALYNKELGNAKLKVKTAYDALSTVYEIKGMGIAEILAFNTKENVEDGEHRGHFWDMYHNMIRVETFDMLLNDNM